MLKISRSFAVLAISALFSSVSAIASTISVDITMAGNSDFSSPLVTFTNLSDVGYQITQTDVGGARADYALNFGSTLISGPAGGTWTPLSTQISTGTDYNDGCSNLTFGLTSFDPGDNFSYTFDPESDTCTSVVYNFETRLNANAVTATVQFTGPGITGFTTLTGSTWTKELINPAQGSSQTNDRYRMTLTGTITDPTPEPATIVLLGSGLAVLGILRRRAA